MADHGGYEISTDAGRLDVDAIWEFLRTSYWSPGVPRQKVAAAIEGSIPFGLYAPDGSQAGYARLVTDGATFGWLADVFVLEAHRGRGLGKALVSEVLAHPVVSGLRQVLLATNDAHGLYAGLGFEPGEPGRHMVFKPAPFEPGRAG